MLSVKLIIQEYVYAKYIPNEIYGNSWLFIGGKHEFKWAESADEIF